jgi:hypothetical protein
MCLLMSQKANHKVSTSRIRKQNKHICKQKTKQGNNNNKTNCIYLRSFLTVDGELQIKKKRKRKHEKK